MVGFCDSLDGAPGGQDYLGIYDGFSRASQGFTFSAWVNPSAALSGARLLDMGNGDGRDNIVIARHLATDTLALDVFNGTAKSRTVLVPGALPVHQWGHLAVTIQGLAVKVYRNGILIHADSLNQPVSSAQRSQSFLGKNSGSAAGYYQGKLDQVELSYLPRGADWIKLSHANQVPGGKLVSLRRELPCQPSLQALRDTAVAEGSPIDLYLRADCALEYAWSVLSGPAPRILDPFMDTLQVLLPRVAGDTTIVFQLEALFQDTTWTSAVRVRVLETIPDPVFTLPDSLSWNGRDTLAIRPVISNLAALQAGSVPALTWSWTLEGIPVDTAWRADGLRLVNPQGMGEIRVGLCLHNNGAPACRKTRVKVDATTSLARQPGRAAEAGEGRAFRDVAGRLRKSGPAYPARFPWRMQP